MCLFRRRLCFVSSAKAQDDTRSPYSVLGGQYAPSFTLWSRKALLVGEYKSASRNVRWSLSLGPALNWPPSPICSTMFSKVMFTCTRCPPCQLLNASSTLFRFFSLPPWRSALMHSQLLIQRTLRQSRIVSPTSNFIERRTFKGPCLSTALCIQTHTGLLMMMVPLLPARRQVTPMDASPDSTSSKALTDRTAGSTTGLTMRLDSSKCDNTFLKNW